MIGLHELRDQLEKGDFAEIFAKELGYADPAAGALRAVNILWEFFHKFPNGRLSLFSSPGRCELGGNHTDHQRGRVLAAAVDADMLCAAAPTGNNTVCLFSEGIGMITVDLSCKEPVPEEKGTAEAIIRGMAAWFEYAGYNITGINAYVSSDVPIGSGMSSSAAFEVLLGTIFNSFFAKNKVSPVDIAKAGQFAENLYFGKPCGLMDQTACAFGGIVSVDFKDPQKPAVMPVEYDFSEKGYDLCIIDTGSSHADLTADYAAITEEMGAVSALFGKEVLSELDRDIVIRHARDIRRTCGDRAYIRAVNYFEEDRRADKMAKALLTDDIDGFLGLVNRSGQSSFMYLQNVYSAGSVKEQAVAAALQAADLSLSGKGAFRVHGGGFAGTIQAYVPRDMTEKFISDMENVLFEGCCRVLKVRRKGAAEITLER